MNLSLVGAFKKVSGPFARIVSDVQFSIREAELCNTSSAAAYVLARHYLNGAADEKYLDKTLDAFRRTMQDQNVDAFAKGEIVDASRVYIKKAQERLQDGQSENESMDQKIADFAPHVQDCARKIKSEVLVTAPIFPFDNAETEKMIEAAEAGDPYDQYALGMRYLEGYNTEQNTEEAMRLLMSAAEGGCLEAHDVVTQHYEDALKTHDAKREKHMKTALAAQQEFQHASDELSRVRGFEVAHAAADPARPTPE